MTPSIRTSTIAQQAAADLLEPPDRAVIDRIVAHEASELERRRREFAARNPEARR